MKKFLFAGLLSLVFLSKVEAQYALPVGSLNETLDKHYWMEWMLGWNNYHRALVGLPPQELDLKLCNAAQFHANHMANTGSFSHYDNYGYTSRARIFGFTGFVQENIAMGQSNPFPTWRASSGHWAAIAGPYRKVGFGYQVNANGAPYWVGLYGND